MVHCVLCRGGAASPTVEVETAAPVDGDSDWAEDMPQEEEDSGGEDSVSCLPNIEAAPSPTPLHSPLYDARREDLVSCLPNISHLWSTQRGLDELSL